MAELQLFKLIKENRAGIIIGGLVGAGAYYFQKGGAETMSLFSVQPGFLENALGFTIQTDTRALLFFITLGAIIGFIIDASNLIGRLR